MNIDELRYRVWFEPEHRYIIRDEAENVPLSKLAEMGAAGDEFKESDYAIERCSGRKDKNDCLIYDGDVLKFTGASTTEYFEVIYDSSSLEWLLLNKEGPIIPEFRNLADCFLSEYEVVWTIHDSWKFNKAIAITTADVSSSPKQDIGISPIAKSVITEPQHTSTNKDNVTDNNSTAADSSSFILERRGIYWWDRDGNNWCVDDFTEQQAKDAAASLVNCFCCTDCVDCINCSYCFACTACTDCEACRHCVDCHSCQHCDSCKTSADCLFCDNETRSVFCDHCVNGKHNDGASHEGSKEY